MVAASVERLAARLGEDADGRALRISQVAHDVRNPLTVIQTSAWSLGRGQQSEKHRSHVGAIEHEVDRVIAMLDDLRLEGRMRGIALSVSPKPCDLGAVTELFLATRTNQAEQLDGVELLLVKPAAPVIAQVDTRRFEQLLQNLTENAVRHAGRGGRVTVTLTEATTGDVCVTVDDTGPGVAPLDRERVFAAQTQGDRPGRAGLGLAISREIARAHGGEITVSVAPSGGARFAVELPNARVLEQA